MSLPAHSKRHRSRMGNILLFHHKLGCNLFRLYFDLSIYLFVVLVHGYSTYYEDYIAHNVPNLQDSFSAIASELDNPALRRNKNFKAFLKRCKFSIYYICRVPNKHEFFTFFHRFKVLSPFLPSNFEAIFEGGEEGK